ncbi:MAG: hypothetical protein KME26_31110 [Oscillatoria princeps RMCB-10]|nr:hypothetical protein [Oscillatoria princeps RMCB-10]
MPSLQFRPCGLFGQRRSDIGTVNPVAGFVFADRRCCVRDRSLQVQGRRWLSPHRQQIDTVPGVGIL